MSLPKPTSAYWEICLILRLFWESQFSTTSGIAKTHWPKLQEAVPTWEGFSWAPGITSVVVLGAILPLASVSTPCSTHIGLKSYILSIHYPLPPLSYVRSGYIDLEYSMLREINLQGFGWSSRAYPSDLSYARAFRFNATAVYAPPDYLRRQYGFPVRYLEK